MYRTVARDILPISGVFAALLLVRWQIFSSASVVIAEAVLARLFDWFNKEETIKLKSIKTKMALAPFQIKVLP